MTILLFGKNGQLGGALRRRLGRRHSVIALGRDDIDLADETSLRELLPMIPTATIIVNAAAYTAVDAAESDVKTAAAINTFAPELLAEEARRRDVPIVHFSSDYVFDGVNRREPYTETDRPNPLSVYGKTKLGGEIAVRETWGKHLIFRTAGIFGTKTNFVETMKRCAANGRTPRVVDDQKMSPNRNERLAGAVSDIIERILESPDVPWGTYHLSGDGSTTWHDLACEVFRLYEKATGEKTAWPVPVTTKEYGVAAPRPAYSVLDAWLVEQTFDIRLPHWKIQLHDCFRTPENAGERYEETDHE